MCCICCICNTAAIKCGACGIHSCGLHGDREDEDGDDPDHVGALNCPFERAREAIVDFLLFGLLSCLSEASQSPLCIGEGSKGTFFRWLSTMYFIASSFAKAIPLTGPDSVR
jgi:hypothetical protein